MKRTLAEFVSVVLTDTMYTWRALLSQQGGSYVDRVRQIVEPGDIDEALNAASQIGDDRLQKQSRGYITPDSFTHGSSEQRARWFKQGYASKQFDMCNTFSAQQL